MTKVEVSSKEPASGFSAAEYNYVAMSSNLIAINMLSSKFDVAPDLFNKGDGVKLSYDIRTLSCYHNEQEDFVAAIFQYEVEGKAGRKRAFKCVADYAVMYAVPDACKSEAAVGFCKNVGKYAAYAYFRSHVAQLSWSAAINLPPLPAIASTAHIPKKKQIDQLDANK